MSDLPREALDYRTVIAEYFLNLRGSGLLLSPLDEEQVAAWEQRGLPVAVVCRGLRAGLERFLESRAPRAPLPRSLRAFRCAVEDEWRAYRSGRVGAAPAPPAEAQAFAERLAAVTAQVAAMGQSVRAPLRPLYARALEQMQAADQHAGPSLEELEELLASIDDGLLIGWIAGLSRAERASLGPQCRLQAGTRPGGTRRSAYRESLRAYLWDAARAAGLIRLRGSV
jgi:hypothetical protein